MFAFLGNYTYVLYLRAVTSQSPWIGQPAGKRSKSTCQSCLSRCRSCLGICASGVRWRRRTAVTSVLPPTVFLNSPMPLYCQAFPPARESLHMWRHYSVQYDTMQYRTIQDGTTCGQCLHAARCASLLVNLPTCQGITTVQYSAM